MGGRGGSGGSNRSGSAVSAKMPALTGSEKQIAWAKDIRDSALLSADANVRNAQRNRALGPYVDPLNPSVSQLWKFVPHL